MQQWSAPTVLLLFTLLVASACGGDGPLQPVPGAEEERIKAELAHRSFRRFDPSVDASARKGVVLSFFGEIRLWAQYAEDGQAMNEWEIAASDYRIERAGGGPEHRLYFDGPRSAQELPARCDDCFQTSGLSISVRDLFDSGRISFRLNDPDRVLPPPFPVFESWTEFMEDEIVN